MICSATPKQAAAGGATKEAQSAQQSGFSQQVVTGTVTDKTGPLPGVTITIKDDPRTSVATDGNGHFTIRAPENGTLVFKTIGYKTMEIPINGASSLNVTMEEEVANLDEVVVVGYGVQKKVDVTGAISSVKGADLKQSPAANLSNSIVGRTPGVIISNRSGEPGRDASEILIRGKGTLNDNSPLIVIDGIANRGDFDRINPEDIESVTILKDASAAIYGAQAANGVILVTTKRGMTGKPTITYTGNYGLTQPTRIPKLIDSYQFVLYKNEISDRLGVPRQFSDADVEGYKNGNDALNFPNTNWYEAVVKDLSSQTRHALSLTGGGEKVNYFLSGGYLYQDGIFHNSGTNFNQYNLRSNTDAQVTDNLKISVDLAGRIEDRKYSNFDSEEIFGRTLITFPTLAAYYPNGLPGAGVEGGLNPALMATGVTGYEREKDYFLQSNLSVEWKLPFITEGLSLTGIAAYDFRFNNNKTLNNNWDAYNYDKVSGEYINLVNNEGPIDLTEAFRNYKLTTYNVRLGYDRTFGDHAIGAFVAYEQSESYDEGISAFRTGYQTDQIDQITVGGSAGLNNDGTAFQLARRNFFGRVTYGYKDKYLAEFILRRDGSFNFAKGKQWGTFPGVSLGWRVSEEPFFERSVAFINELKIKASWGRLGNDKIDAYQHLLQFNPDNGYYFGTGNDRVPGLSMGVVPNVDVTWEVADNKNVGIESSLWNGLLNVNADYFYSKRSNILLPRNASIPTSTGLNSTNLSSENIGKVNNRGYELEISHHRNVNDNFSYHVGVNLTHAKNKVVYMDEAANIPDWQRIEGHPMDSWLLYKSAGIYHTQAEVDESAHLPGAMPGDIRYLDINGDGRITSNDRIRIYDSPTPMNIYGVVLGANFKGFGVNMLWQGQGSAQQVILPQQINDNATIPVWMFEDRWTADHTNGTMPASFDRTDSKNNLVSDFWIRNAAFIRLKTVEVSYTIPKSVVSQLNMQDLGVFVSGFNLFTISEIKDYDPELNAVSGSYYPQTRIFNLGVRASL
ncbi:SusC/RagA family TonB-linked outer membrane protein [Parapedobacter defluvii]|uniref:SusC/RagA family TonB-linked outer membrane protein n=1 Tax=Parapedobacter defluvii TaxID=2045106 RepID=A0ABQ1MEL6_9SPHI|nr:SusC/RagA family TonB-linked outer membrane protein [Parapedobacter defluvii]